MSGLVLSQRMLRTQKRKRVRPRTDQPGIEPTDPIPDFRVGMQRNHADWTYPVLIGQFKHNATGQITNVVITYELRGRMLGQMMDQWMQACPTTWQREYWQTQQDRHYTTEIKRSRSDGRRGVR